MKINDFIGTAPIRAEDSKNSAKSSQSRNVNDIASRFGEISDGGKQVFGEDTVTISLTSRQLAQISQIIADDKTERAEKIELLKQKIINGEYSLSSEEVARALLNYIEKTEV